MLYQPTMHRHLWDTWMYWADGVFHLYYLYMTSSASPGDGIAHATSTDGVHWSEKGSVIPKSPDADWLGSGAVWRTGDRYIMNFSELRDGVQGIFFAESHDLNTWKRLDGISQPDPRWYNNTSTGRWDCIFPLQLSDGSFQGYLTAVPWMKRDREEGVDFVSFGRVGSKDGVHWEALPPPIIDWCDTAPSAMAKISEVGAIRKIGGDLHLTVVGWGAFGDRNGTYSFRGRKPEGPFKPVAKAFRLLSSRRFVMTNFLRFIDGAPEHLMHHTSIERNGERWFPLIKAVGLDDEGNLEIRYWTGNDALKSLPVSLDAKQARVLKRSEATAEFRSELMTLESNSRAVAHFEENFGQAALIEVTTSVVPPIGGHGGSGFYLELAGGQSCIVLVQTNGQASFLDVAKEQLDLNLHWARTGTDIVDVGIGPDTSHTIRLFVRGSLLELYVDERLAHVYSMAAEATGRFGLVAETATVDWSKVAVWEMTVDPHTARTPEPSPPWLAA